MLNWLAQDENLITVQPRASIDSQLRLSQFMVNILGLFFLITLPLLFLFAGGMIWLRRRRA